MESLDKLLTLEEEYENLKKRYLFCKNQLLREKDNPILSDDDLFSLAQDVAYLDYEMYCVHDLLMKERKKFSAFAKF